MVRSVTGSPWEAARCSQGPGTRLQRSLRDATSQEFQSKLRDGLEKTVIAMIETLVTKKGDDFRGELRKLKGTDEQERFAQDHVTFFTNAAKVVSEDRCTCTQYLSVANLEVDRLA